MSGSPRSAKLVHSVIKAYDVRGLVGQQIDEGFTHDVGAAFARLMRSEGAAQVAIAHDMRPSSPSLSQAFAEGVMEQGLDVVLVGLASTDEAYFASGLLQCPAAMFTASHNPASYNGIKMCRADAKPVGLETGLAVISDDVIAGVPDYKGPRGTLTQRPLLGEYVEKMLSLVDLSGLPPLKIAIDAGNGMAGLTAPAVFDRLPVTVEPLYFELDGNFPNHEANPLDPKNLVDLQRLVQRTGADLGLAFDGDADRCFFIDERGQAISPSAVTACIAAGALRSEPGATVIYNVITSKSVPEIVSEMGGVPLRTRVGHSFIKGRMAQTQAVFGGEHSGHYYFRDFWYADSGMLAALNVLAAIAADPRPISELMVRFTRYADSGEINFTVDDASAATDEVVGAFADRALAVDKLDGVTVDLGKSTWFNLRSSNTEPLLRLNVEAPTREQVRLLVDEITSLIK